MLGRFWEFLYESDGRSLPLAYQESGTCWRMLIVTFCTIYILSCGLGLLVYKAERLEVGFAIRPSALSAFWDIVSTTRLGWMLKRWTE
jgi:hypothetical protein